MEVGPDEQVIYISIHALRKEGDGETSYTTKRGRQISIHALRKEGDFAQ